MKQPDLFTGQSGRTDAPDVLAALDVDYTPMGLVVQGLLALQAEVWSSACVQANLTPRRVLDPSAGSGAWGRGVRAVFGDVRLDAVEVRESEAANLAGTHDRVVIGDARDFAALTHVRQRRISYDLVVTNPSFSTAFAASSFWPRMFMDAGVVCPGGHVALYGLSQWGQGEEVAPILRACPPVLQIRFGGRPAHRADGQTDAREYSLWVWRRRLDEPAASSRPSWRTVQLPVLPVALRRWSPSAIPGTYPIDQALVDEIRSRYL
ncbi:MAG: hypothetical protein JNL82_29770 [Myxococcales bacterium]|nr:hypothetical protein [Myxococcales bacterium]